MTAILEIFLNDIRTGTLTLLPDGAMIFVFDEAYEHDSNRPTLSQSFYSADRTLLTSFRPTRSGAAPPFFSNLLPEGHLRKYLAERAGIKESQEFHLLHLLGEDLPGAVIAKPAKDFSLSLNKHSEESPKHQLSHEQPFRFSLAGVQLKFSALMAHDGGLSIPASGIGGNWIVKLPSPTHDLIPENEFAMMHMAAAVGIPTPEIQLIPLNAIAALPDFGKLRGAQALAVKRFDRTTGGGRLHIEDFAQVYTVPPDKKYESVSFTNIAGMIWTLTGEAGLKDFIRRLTFTILTGNGDMHLKNWSFIYRDGLTPHLAPAYDMVSTIPYIPNDKLALKFVNTKNMDACDESLFQKLAEKARLPKTLVRETVRSTATATREIWSKEKSHFNLPSDITKTIDRHMKTIPL